MKTVKKTIALLLVSLSLAACIKMSDSGGDAGESGAAAVPQREFEIIQKNEPNHYEVRLITSDDAPVVQRSSDTDKALKMIALDFREGQMIDPTVKAGETYTYQIGVIRGGQLVAHSKIVVPVPKDLVIDHEVSLSQDTVWIDYRRIFFTPAGILTTNGFQLYIQTNEIQCQKGLLRTFPSGSQAALDQAGKSGGKIRLEAQTLIGQLSVEMRGQRGGNGKGGSGSGIIPGNWPDPSKGEPGHDGKCGGNSGIFEAFIESLISPDNIHPIFDVGAGGIAGKGGLRIPMRQEHIDGGYGIDGKPGPSGGREFFCIQDPQGRICY